jgi:tetrahydromethanopterin S-methyltransferase subunit E
MKNKTGIIGGFAFGMIGFLLMFKLIFLDNIPPSDELAPGIVVFASIVNGLLFAFIGYLIQNRFGKRTTTTESE